MKGDILSNRSAIDRSKTEFYPTPPEVTIALLKYLKLPMGTKIWEPACGEGHMAEIIKKSGYEVVASDIEFKPKAILPLTWRPDFLFGKKGGSPTMECIWTIWGTKPAEITEYKLLEKPVLQEGGRR